MPTPVLDPRLEAALVLVLWTEPYSTWFAERCGGLPKDWLNEGRVTAESIARCQIENGIDNPFARMEVRVAEHTHEEDSSV